MRSLSEIVGQHVVDAMDDRETAVQSTVVRWSIFHDPTQRNPSTE